jgi:hypothetical protein
MVSAGGGGGFGLPNVDNPIELLVVLVIFAALIWLGFRIFSS